MDVLVLVGPPAVGKMSVGREVARLTGWKLFHNHLTVEPMIGIFEFGSPSFNRLVPTFRRMIIEEAVSSELPGLVFTYLWDFDDPDDQSYLERLLAPVRQAGGRVVFAELFADLETRLAREGTPERLAHKFTKRDVAAARELQHRLEATARTSSRPGEFPYPDAVAIDTTELEPPAAALRIVTALDLPTIRTDHVSG